MHDFKAEMTDRTRNFALPVFRLCKSLHGCYEMEHVGRRLLRSATSVAANFRAACYAKSTQVFMQKSKLVKKKRMLLVFGWSLLLTENCCRLIACLK